VACFSADGTMAEPGADYQDTPANVFNQAANNPSVTSKKRALFNINVKRNNGTLTTPAKIKCDGPGFVPTKVWVNDRLVWTAAAEN